MPKLKLAKSVFDISKLDSYHSWFFLFDIAEVRVRLETSHFSKYLRQAYFEQDQSERIVDVMLIPLVWSSFMNSSRDSPSKASSGGTKPFL
jgi:hypothetical protein